MEKKEEKTQEDIQEETQEETSEEVQSDQEVEVKEEKIEIDPYDELNDRHLRLQAEYQNFRRRTEKEKSDIYRYANEKIITNLLPLLDNMDRAIIAVKESQDKDSMIQGIEKLKKSFEELLEREEVVQIETENAAFDPNKHHAVISEEAEGVEEGMILEELQRGYEFKDKVIRPAMVKVSK